MSSISPKFPLQFLARQKRKFNLKIRISEKVFKGFERFFMSSSQLIHKHFEAHKILIAEKRLLFMLYLTGVLFYLSSTFQASYFTFSSTFRSGNGTLHSPLGGGGTCLTNRRERAPSILKFILESKFIQSLN